MLANASPWPDNSNCIERNLSLETCQSKAFLTIMETSIHLCMTEVTIVEHIKSKNLICKKINDRNKLCVTVESINYFVSKLPNASDEDLDKYLLTINENVQVQGSLYNKSLTSKAEVHKYPQNNKVEEPNYFHVSEPDLEPQNKNSVEKPLVGDNGLTETIDTLTVDYVSSYVGKDRVIPGYPCLAIRSNKKSVVIYLKVKNTDHLELIKLSRDSDITEENIKNVHDMYEKFLYRREKGMPWNAISYLIPGGQIEIISLKDLFNFGMQEFPSQVTKIKRFIKRYLSGEKGDRKLEDMCQEDFIKVYLENKGIEGRKKTDRNVLITLFSSFFHKAKGSQRVKTLGFDNLVAGLKRTRGKPRPAPELNTFIMILKKTFDMNEHELTLNLLLQESVFMRKTLTTTQTVDCISCDDFKTEVGAELHKNGTMGSYLHTPQLDGLLSTYLKHLSQQKSIYKTKPGTPRFLFESPIKKGQARNNFDNAFNKDREAVIEDIKSKNLPDNETDKMIKSLQKFTQHRIRALNDKLLHIVGVTEGQKENAFNRSVRQVSSAYEDLSDEEQREFKAKKFDYIVTKHPEYKEIIDGLMELWNKTC